MENLIVFISPTKSFDNPRSDLINDAALSVKVQIENSLALGWTDIMLVTNFPYEYMGVEALVLDVVEFFERKPQASKINAIIKLFELGLIDEHKTYWFHDLDAFQVADVNIGLGYYDLACTDYGRNPRWSTGVIYFKKSAHDLFCAIRDTMYKLNIDEERALTLLTRTNEDINKRVLKIDKSYNYTPKHIKTMYPAVLKPIKVIHFHPLGTVSRLNRQSAFDWFMGNNRLGIQFIHNPLMSIFAKNGVK